MKKLHNHLLNRIFEFGGHFTSPECVIEYHLSVSTTLNITVCICVCLSVSQPLCHFYSNTGGKLNHPAKRLCWHVKLLFMDRSSVVKLSTELNMNKGLYLMSIIPVKNACVTGCVSDSSSSFSHPMGDPA